MFTAQKPRSGAFVMPFCMYAPPQAVCRLCLRTLLRSFASERNPPADSCLRRGGRCERAASIVGGTFPDKKYPVCNTKMYVLV